MTRTDSKPVHSRNTVLDTLSASFKVFRDCQPLAIGIHKTIRERQPEIDPQHLRAAMKIHTASTRYLKVLSQTDKRFDLDGNPVGEVTAEQRKQALDTLRERFGKQAAQHKEKQLAQQRQENLLKLAEKFNAR